LMRYFYYRRGWHSHGQSLPRRGGYGENQ